MTTIKLKLHGVEVNVSSEGTVIVEGQDMWQGYIIHTGVYQQTPTNSKWICRGPNNVDLNLPVDDSIKIGVVLHVPKDTGVPSAVRSLLQVMLLLSEFKAGTLVSAKPSLNRGHSFLMQFAAYGDKDSLLTKRIENGQDLTQSYSVRAAIYLPKGLASSDSNIQTLRSNAYFGLPVFGYKGSYEVSGLKGVVIPPSSYVIMSMKTQLEPGCVFNYLTYCQMPQR